MPPRRRPADADQDDPQDMARPRSAIDRGADGKGGAKGRQRPQRNRSPQGQAAGPQLSYGLTQDSTRFRPPDDGFQRAASEGPRDRDRGKERSPAPSDRRGERGGRQRPAPQRSKSNVSETPTQGEEFSDADEQGSAKRAVSEGPQWDDALGRQEEREIRRGNRRRDRQGQVNREKSNGSTASTMLIDTGFLPGKGSIPRERQGGSPVQSVMKVKTGDSARDGTQTHGSLGFDGNFFQDAVRELRRDGDSNVSWMSAGKSGGGQFTSLASVAGSSMDSVDGSILKAINRTSQQQAKKHLSTSLNGSRDTLLKEEPVAPSFGLQGKPKARIILTHQSPHNASCERVCLIHVHYLIRVLPYGRVTPRKELAVEALAAVQRRHEEQFVVKTYRHFEDLREMIATDAPTKSWGETNFIRNLPKLPVASIQAAGCWSKLCAGARHNPDLEASLQGFMDTVLDQMPALASEPHVKRFFEEDRVSITYPLVQQVLKVQGEFSETMDGPSSKSTATLATPLSPQTAPAGAGLRSGSTFASARSRQTTPA